MLSLMPLRRNDIDLFNYLDTMEKSIFGDMSSDKSQIRTDIIENENEYELTADLPGFNKEDIQISLSDDVLSITAEHTDTTEEKDTNYIRRERKYGSFQRSFSIEGIDSEKIKAAYENGVLKLILPKSSPIKPKKIEISLD